MSGVTNAELQRQIRDEVIPRLDHTESRVIKLEADHAYLREALRANDEKTSRVYAYVEAKIDGEREKAHFWEAVRIKVTSGSILGLLSALGTVLVLGLAYYFRIK